MRYVQCQMTICNQGCDLRPSPNDFGSSIMWLISLLNKKNNLSQLGFRVRGYAETHLSKASLNFRTLESPILIRTLWELWMQIN